MATVTSTRYIVVWRRSPTSRYLDVQMTPDGAEIAVFTDGNENATRMPVIEGEADLVSYINGTETDTKRVEADLAHRVLGWNIP